jgi:hypothetical protein
LDRLVNRMKAYRDIMIVNMMFWNNNLEER